MKLFRPRGSKNGPLAVCAMPQSESMLSRTAPLRVACIGPLLRLYLRQVFLRIVDYEETNVTSAVLSGPAFCGSGCLTCVGAPATAATPASDRKFRLKNETQDQEYEAARFPCDHHKLSRPLRRPITLRSSMCH